MDRTFCADVHWSEGSYVWSPQAFEVNRFTHERILNAPYAADEVDDQLAEWLEDLGAEPRQVIPIGWNVGSFDMPFVRRTFPSAGRFFPHRSLDLNSVCFTMSGLMDTGGTPAEWDGIKRMANRYAEEMLGGEAEWHDALYDAKASVLAWRYLRNLLAVK